MGRRGAYWLIITTVGILLTVAAWLWFAPSGTGEYLRSPDGRFTAHVSNLSAGTWAGSREQYIQVRIVEEASDREVWRVVRPHSALATVPDYGSRADRFLVWAADSSSVTVPVGGGQQLILPVP